MNKRKSHAHDYDRESDGVEYIAISSKARTRLGRALAAGGHLPLEHRDYGHFNSVAGLIRYLGGDHREINREISGVEYDDAITDKLGNQYEEVLQEHVKQALNTLAFLKADIRQAAADKLPFILFHNVEDEWVQLEMPLWMSELIQDMFKQMAIQDGKVSAMAMSMMGPAIEAELAKADAPDLKEITVHVHKKDGVVSAEVVKCLDWDPKVLETPGKTAAQRTLLELQTAWLEANAGTNAAVDFVVSQEEYDSIPENVRTMMGETLKLQRAIDGTAVPAPPKKIM